MAGSGTEPGAIVTEHAYLPNGARADTTFTYDDAGRLAERFEPLGRTTTFSYDGVGNVLSETLTGGTGFQARVTDSVYDELDRRVAITRQSDGGPITVSMTYDGAGNKLTETDPLGRVTEIDYDDFDRPIEVREPESKVTELVYDGNGNLIEERQLGGAAGDVVRELSYDGLNRLIAREDGNDDVTLFEYDRVGNLVREIRPLLNFVTHAYDARNRRESTTQHLSDRDVVFEFSYDAVGNLTEERQPNGNVITHTYDGLDRLLTSADTLGPLVENSYDANGNLLTTEDANGNLTTNTWDALNRLTEQTLPEERTLVFTYDAAGNRLTETDARDNTTTFEYDRLDRLVRTIDPAPFAFETTITYDDAGNKLTETDRRGNTTAFAYDDLNRLVTVTDPPPLSHQTTFTYDPLGNRLTETDRRGIVTAFEYDLENRLTRTVRSGLEIERVQYDGNGNRRFVTDANGNITGFEYDQRDLLTAENRPLAAITRFTLDDMGDVAVERDPENRETTRTYDVRRRLRFETNEAGETTEFTYDGNGNRTAMIRPETNDWTFAYDGADRLTSVTDPLDQVTSFTYDKNGNRLSQTDANLHTTSFEYDELDRRTALERHDTTREAFEYDENGNPTLQTDALNQTIARAYDALNRETLRTYSLPAVLTGDDIQTIATTYDPNGNPTTITETYTGTTGTRVTTRSYDNFDRLTQVTDAFGEPITYGYDPNGNRTQLTDPDGRVTLYAFDDLNRPTSVTMSGVGVTEYEYFKDDRLKEIRYPSGAEARYTYDDASRVETITNLQNTAPVSSFSYGYDDNGNRIEQIETRGGAPETTTYTYDLADRLLTVSYPDQDVVYTYDDVGNRATEVTTDTVTSTVVVDRTLGYDTRDRLTTITDNLDATQSVTYGYDANGNQTSRTQGGVSRTFTFDVRDQVVEIRDGGTLLSTALYDYQGLRVAKRPGVGATIRYVYDDQSVLLQTDVSGQTLAKYDYGPDRLLSLDHATEGRQFYLFDALGSVSELMTPVGAVQARYVYDAWGNFRSTTGSSENPFGFTGHELDEETGLYYAKARYYDPGVGRFLTEDPFEGAVEQPPSLHRYLYAFGNPTVFVDPTGTITILEFAQKGFEIGETVLEGLVSGLARSEFGQTGFGREVTSDVARVAGIVAGNLEVAAEGTELLNNATNLALVGFLLSEGVRLGPLTDQAVSEETARFLETLELAIDGLGAANDFAELIEEDPTAAGIRVSLGLVKKGAEVGEFLERLSSEDPVEVFQASKQLPKVAAAIASGGLVGRTKAVRAVQETAEEAVEQLARAGRRSVDPVPALPAPSLVPNAGSVIRSFVTSEDRVFYRVFSGDNQVGAFLTSVRPRSRAFAREALDLPPGNTAEFVQEVLVPAGTRLQRSRVGSGAFGGRGGAEQFQLLEEIPVRSFRQGVRLE